MIMNKFGYLVLSFFGLIFLSGYNMNHPEFISPDSIINKQMKGKGINEINHLRFEYEENKLTLDPVLPSEWTWFAGRGFKVGDTETLFFFWNGILFTNNSELKFTNFRSKKYPTVFSDIQSNTFTICFQRHDEAVLFTAVDKGKDVEIIIPKKYMGKELKFNFHLKDNEAKFMRISSTKPPFKP